MQKSLSLFAASLVLVTLACRRAESTPPAAPKEVAGVGPTTPDVSPMPAGEMQAVPPDCSPATIDAQPETWQDGKECVEQLRPACEQGDPEACVGAATILVNGGGGAARDPAAALALVTTACDRKLAPACLIAAVLHEEGIGVPADPAAANAFIARACELGDTRACEAATARAPKGPGVVANANLQVASIAADGLELRDLMCEVTGGMPMLGALMIVGTLAKQKRALDRCAPAGQAFAVTWTLAGGQAKDAVALGGTAAANKCVAAAVGRSGAALDGRCGAIVLVGKLAAATATIDAVRSGTPPAR